MALLDFLKNKKEKDKAREAKAKITSVTPKTEKTQKVIAKKEPEKAVEKKETVVVAGKGFSYSIIKKPHISEKATDLTGLNKYTFKVYANSNKLEIKKSVEGIYNVDVLDVNIIKIPHKKRRLGRTEGFKKAFTKALVTIKEGQKIELF